MDEVFTGDEIGLLKRVLVEEDEVNGSYKLKLNSILGSPSRSHQIDVIKFTSNKMVSAAFYNYQVLARKSSYVDVLNLEDMKPIKSFNLEAGEIVGCECFGDSWIACSKVGNLFVGNSHSFERQVSMFYGFMWLEAYIWESFNADES
jgi:hypothetical protein